MVLVEANLTGWYSTREYCKAAIQPPSAKSGQKFTRVAAQESARAEGSFSAARSLPGVASGAARFPTPGISLALIRSFPMARRASSQTLTDHKKIRRWAEERRAWPACVRKTRRGKDVGMIRLDFPGYSGAGSLEEISWDEWFEKFDDHGLALIVQNQTTRGQRSNFNKIVGRDTVKERARTRRGTSRHPRAKSAPGRRRTAARLRSAQRARSTGRRGRAAWKASAIRTAKTVRSKRGRSARGSRSGSRRGGARVVSITAGRSRRAQGRVGKKRASATTGQSRRRAA